MGWRGSTHRFDSEGWRISAHRGGDRESIYTGSTRPRERGRDELVDPGFFDFNLCAFPEYIQDLTVPS